MPDLDAFKDFFLQHRKILSMNIKRLRKAKRIGADEMANILNMSTPNYYKLESGGSQTVKAEWLPVIAAKFGISVNDMFGHVPSNPKKVADEEELLRVFRTFGDKEQVLVLQLIKYLRVNSISDTQLKAITELARTING